MGDRQSDLVADFTNTQAKRAEEQQPPVSGRPPVSSIVPLPASSIVEVAKTQPSQAGEKQTPVGNRQSDLDVTKTQAKRPEEQQPPVSSRPPASSIGEGAKAQPSQGGEKQTPVGARLADWVSDATKTQAKRAEEQQPPVSSRPPASSVAEGAKAQPSQAGEKQTFAGNGQPVADAMQAKRTDERQTPVRDRQPAEVTDVAKAKAAEAGRQEMPVHDRQPAKVTDVTKMQAAQADERPTPVGAWQPAASVANVTKIRAAQVDEQRMTVTLERNKRHESAKSVRKDMAEKSDTVFEGFNNLGKNLFNIEGAKKIAAWYVDASEKFANDLLDLQASAAGWAKQTPLAPILEAQTELSRNFVKRSIDLARTTWQLNS
jgi:hypothetical protein